MSAIYAQVRMYCNRPSTHPPNVKGHHGDGDRTLTGQNQADQNLVKTLPLDTRKLGTPDRSKNQNTTEKNHRFREGAIRRISRMKKPHCLNGCRERWVSGDRWGSRAP